MSAQYTIEEFTREISVEEYLARFHNPAEVWGYCRACSNYGRQWGCPPFRFDVVERLSQYDKVLLVVTKITPTEKGSPYREAEKFIRTERIRLEKQLLDLESQLGGLACTHIGTCLHCPEGTCTRPQGGECRHPECVRSSMEAYGFDVAKTLSELFDIELQWSTKELSPEYITLACGVFYNG